jgi:hypothetical protein
MFEVLFYMAWTVVLIIASSIWGYALASRRHYERLGKFLDSDPQLTEAQWNKWGQAMWSKDDYANKLDIGDV